MKTFKQFMAILEAQEYTSEATSRNQVPAGDRFAIQRGLIKPDTISVAHGGGRYDLASKSVMKSIPGSTHLVHDPFNRSDEHNQQVRNRSLGAAHYASLHNVLNVIKEPEERLKALQQLKDFLHPDGIAHITVYTGGQDKDKPPGQTKDGWQNRRPTKSYIPEIQQVFSPDEYHLKTYGENILLSKKPLPSSLPIVNQYQRYREPGKKVGNALYIHKDHIDTLSPEDQQIIYDRQIHLPADFRKLFNIIKLQTVGDKKIVSYIQSKNFDTAPEPTVGDAYAVHDTGKVTKTPEKEDPQMYHHKWVFVTDDSTRFDVNESKARSKSYENLLKHIAKTEDPRVKNKIGTRSYWVNNILSRLFV